MAALKLHEARERRGRDGARQLVRSEREAGQLVQLPQRRGDAPAQLVVCVGVEAGWGGSSVSYVMYF